MSHNIVMAGLVPAIHVFLVFQQLSEQSFLLNFPMDNVGLAAYGGRIPIRLRGVLQAKLDVNGDGAPRPRSRSRGPGRCVEKASYPTEGGSDGIFRRAAGSDDQGLMSLGAPAGQRGPII